MRMFVGLLLWLLAAVPLVVAQDAEWNRTVDAAKKEALLVIGGPPARSLRSALTDEFAKAYPEIKIEYVGGLPHELKTFKDLLDPKWKGKIAMDDPRREGPGIEALAVLANSQGKEFVQKLLAQEVTFTRQPRQIAEWVARGSFPIAIGAGTGPLTD